MNLCHHCYLLCVCHQLHISYEMLLWDIILQATDKELTIYCFLDDLKLYENNEKSLESLIQTLRLFSSDMGMEFGKMCSVNNEERKDG